MSLGALYYGETVEAGGMMIRFLMLVTVVVMNIGCAMTTSYGVKPERDAFDSIAIT